MVKKKAKKKANVAKPETESEDFVVPEFVEVAYAAATPKRAESQPERIARIRREKGIKTSTRF